ncbi:hypothetical protein HRI_000732100 [Hibiscus trionum]|uniref:Integrase catalytic domain-containing protein n=1 Tax=Hibiscus trionum TaxID=183268 RepID=A0A9W7H562_HIBTR|nr:hypothetical protein HRI_000732100 [Hibiscus trionum]
MLPNFEEVFSVETDASDLGVGAVLVQRGKPLAFFSKGLGPKHQKLSVYEKEILAVLMAVKRWFPYLVGRHFKIRTDHQSLKFLAENQAITPAQQKWVAKMMGFDYEVCYRKGTHNIVADCLSRKPNEVGCLNMSVSSVTTDTLNRVAATWVQDGRLKKIIDELKRGTRRNDKYSWDGRKLKRKGKLVVRNDETLRREILNFFHISPAGGHSGAHVTSQRVANVFYWKGLKREVRNLVKECGICQRNKDDLQHPRGLLQPLPIPETTWSCLSMDFIEGLPNSKKKDYILVVVDRLTKYGHFIPLAHPFTAKEVAQIFLENIFKLHGMPSYIVYDRDKVFMSMFWKEMFRKLGVTITPSTAYHPDTDGQTERLNKCLESYLRCMTGERPKEWAGWLHLAEWWYNSSFHSAIQTSPYQALYGQSPPVHHPYIAGDSLVDSVDRTLQRREAANKMMKFYLRRAQDRMKQQADKRRTECEFQPGEWVFLKLQPYRQQSVKSRGCQKLAAKWFGPFQIIENIGKVAYRLKLTDNSRVHPAFHVSQLKKHIGSDMAQADLPIIGPDGSISKEPLKILERRIGRRGNRTVTEVLVEWTNSFPEDATWEILHQLQMQFPDFNP